MPGGCSLHNTMLPHGPDRDAFEGASNAELKPHKLEGTMAFMFETRFPQRVTAYAAGIEQLQKDYGYYGHELKKHFDPSQARAALVMPQLDATHDPEAAQLGRLGRRPPGLSDPEPAAGRLQPAGRRAPRAGVAIGDEILDLARCAAAGLLAGEAGGAVGPRQAAPQRAARRWAPARAGRCARGCPSC